MKNESRNNNSIHTFAVLHVPGNFTESQTVSETNFKEEALETIPLSEEMTSLEETVSLEETSPVQEIASTFEQERESILSKEESQEGTSLETGTPKPAANGTQPSVNPTATKGKRLLEISVTFM